MTYKKAEERVPRTHRGKPLRSYEVYVSGRHVGIVEQSIRHSYRTNGRLRYGDTYSVKWQARLPGESLVRDPRLHADTRTQAVQWLLEGSKRRAP